MESDAGRKIAESVIYIALGVIIVVAIFSLYVFVAAILLLFVAGNLGYEFFKFIFTHLSREK